MDAAFNKMSSVLARREFAFCIHTYSMQRETAGAVLVQYEAFLCEVNRQMDRMITFDCFMIISAEICPHELSSCWELCSSGPGPGSRDVRNYENMQRSSRTTQSSYYTE